MKYTLFNELCESKLFPSIRSLEKETFNDIATKVFLTCLILVILLAENENIALKYLKKTGKSFDDWRKDANDLHAGLFALCSDMKDKSIAQKLFVDWIREPQHTSSLLSNLDSKLSITDSKLKSLRREISHWSTADDRKKTKIANDLLASVKSEMPKSELLDDLKRLIKNNTWNNLNETTAGATCAASVATVVKPVGADSLGAGFDTNGDKGIYGNSTVLLMRRPKIS